MPSVSYGGGGGVKVNASVSNSATASGAGNNTFATLYTCPANCYAIVAVRADYSRPLSSFSYGTGHYIYVGGQVMASAGTTGTGAQSGPIANGQVTLFQFYVGPGQTVQVRNDNNSGYGASSATTGYIQGTEFINS